MWKKLVACLAFVMFSSLCFSQSVSISYSQLSEIRTQLTSLKLQLKQNEKLRLDLNTQIENLDKTLTNYTELTADLNKRIQNLETLNKGLKDQISNLERDLSNYEGLVKDLKKEIDTVEKESKKLKTSLMVLKVVAIVATSVAVYKIGEDFLKGDK